MASPEFVSGNGGTQFMPFASFTCAADLSICERLSQQCQNRPAQKQGSSAFKRLSNGFCDIGGSLAVPDADTFVEAMAGGFAQHGLAQGVGPVDQFDGFAVIQALNDRAVVFDKGRRVAFSQIGQHAKQVMRAD